MKNHLAPAIRFLLIAAALLFLSPLAFMPAALAMDAPSQTPLQAALAGSAWSEYQLIDEASDGALSCGIAVRLSTGKAILAIAQALEDAPALLTCFENAIPEGLRLDGMYVEADNASKDYNIPTVLLVLQTKPDDTMSYLRVHQYEDGSWRCGQFCGDYEGETYSVYPWNNQLDLNRHNDDHGFASVEEGVIDLSPEGFSYTHTLEIAAREIDRRVAEQRAEVNRLLAEAFPDADFSVGELVGWSMWTEEDRTAAIAVADSGRARTTYLMDRNGAELICFTAASLIPREADKESISVDIPYYYEGGVNENYPVYLSFTLESYEYSMEVTRDKQNRCVINNMSYATDQSDWQYVDFHEKWMRIHPEKLLGNGYLYRAPNPLLGSMETFDPLLARAEIEQAYADVEAGEPPFIPEMDAEYAFPQPCGAKLKAGTYDVYTGPGKEYFREADGKACVSAKDWVQVFGREGDWALVQYRVKGGLLRFGYIQRGAFADWEAVPKLSFEAVELRQDNGFVTSNPYGVGGQIELTGEVILLTRLCTLDDYWMYVELAMPNGKPARMFAEIEASHG